MSLCSVSISIASYDQNTQEYKVREEGLILARDFESSHSMVLGSTSSDRKAWWQEPVAAEGTFSQWIETECGKEGLWTTALP